MLSEKIRIHPAEGTWVIRAGGAIIGETDAALELLEENYLPLIFFPRADLGMAFLDPSETISTCPYKGTAHYYNLVTQNEVIPDVGWSYDAPSAGAERIAGLVTFHPNRVTIEQI